jgi:YtcA family
MRHQPNRMFAEVLLLIAAISLTGCERAPSIDVLGSFFPACLLCLILGIVLTTGTRFLLLKIHLEEALSPPVAMYASLTALFTFGIWLLFFH